MKHITIQERVRKPVSHDPSLIKELLVGSDILPGIDSISHITIDPGTVINEHSHNNGSEVFYCIRGNAEMLVAENKLKLGKGDCLIVEPGEGHSFINIKEETELLYFFVPNPSF